jgi:hypothetical protein
MKSMHSRAGQGTNRSNSRSNSRSYCEDSQSRHAGEGAISVPGMGHDMHSPLCVRRAGALVLALAGGLWAPQAAAQAGAIAGQAIAGQSSGGGVVLHGGAVFAQASTPVLTGGSLPGGVAGSAYRQSLSATGGTPPYAYLLSGGSLPPGVVLTAAGVLSGTPTAAGTYRFTVQVTDAAAQVIVVTYQWVVAPASSPAGPLAVPLGGPVAGALLGLLLLVWGGAARRRKGDA